MHTISVYLTVAFALCLYITTPIHPSELCFTVSFHRVLSKEFPCVSVFFKRLEPMIFSAYGMKYLLLFLKVDFRRQSVM